MSDYTKIENLSDGVGFSHIVDAYYPNSIEINKIKYNSKQVEDWERNFIILNDSLQKIKSLKQVDPMKLTKNKFNINFEFLQFMYDFILKNFPNDNLNILTKYNAFERRLEAIKNQYGKSFINNSNNEAIKKFLPSHLIPNDVIMKLDKTKYLQNNTEENQQVENNNEDDTNKDNKDNINSNSRRINILIDKYKDFLGILKEDLKKNMEKNTIMANEIHDIEEERTYYLDKLQNVHKFIGEKRDSVSEEIGTKLDDIVKIINHIPEDFK